VANALERTGGEEVTETVRFIRMVDKFFDCLNVTNFGSGIRKKKSFQEPYRRRPEGDGTDDFRLKVKMHNCKKLVVLIFFLLTVAERGVSTVSTSMGERRCRADRL